MTNNPFKKTLPLLPAATAFSDADILLVRRAGETHDMKLTGALLAAYVREALGLPNITVSDTPPENPQVGDLWVDTSN